MEEEQESKSIAVAKIDKRYSEEELQNLLRESARIGAQEALKLNNSNKNKKKDYDDDDDSDSGNVINPKIVKQLKDTVAVFTALKDLSSNPLQKTIEETVGLQATNVVQNAFQPRQNQNRDIWDTILNSQFAYGLGSGIGQRGPEIVESMGRTFGNEKTYSLLADAIKYGSKGGGGGGSGNDSGIKNVTSYKEQTQTQAQTQTAQPASAGLRTPTESAQVKEQVQTQTQDNKSVGSTKASDEDRELILNLDPNNPQHMAAYCENQGGVSIEVGKKLLDIHQNAFLKQMKNEGKDISKWIKQSVNNNDNGIADDTPTKVAHPIKKNNNLVPIMKKEE